MGYAGCVFGEKQEWMVGEYEGDHFVRQYVNLRGPKIGINKRKKMTGSNLMALDEVNCNRERTW